jgi:hypothetical protein
LSACSHTSLPSRVSSDIIHPCSCSHSARSIVHCCLNIRTVTSCACIVMPH